MKNDSLNNKLELIFRTKDDLNNKLKSDFDIFKEVFNILKLTNKYYDKICKKFNITRVQLDVLYFLYTSEELTIKMSSLGDDLGMARSGVTILVDRMTLAGLIKRRPDVSDRRIINIVMTEKGAQIMNELFPSNEISKLSILDFMQQDEKELLCKLMVKIKEKLESKACTM